MPSATRPARTGLVLLATSLAAFTATLDNTVVAVALRDIQADLGAGVAELQGIVTAYTVALAALLLTGGTLADVAGRRRVFVSGLGLFALASAGCALAGSPGTLIAARAVQGCGAALVLPGGLAVLAAAYPDPGRRARAVGIWSATGAGALVAGPVVGGLLVAAAGWQAVFWVNVPLCALVAAVALLTPEGAAAGGRRLDLPGQALVAVGLAAGTYAVVLAGRDGLGLPVLVSGAVSVACLLGFVGVERRTSDPVLPLGLLRERGFVGATLGAFAASLAVFVLLVFLSLFLQLVEQREALPSALRLLPLTLVLVVVAPLAGRWAARRGARAPVVTGLLLTGVGLALIALRLRQGIADDELVALLALSGIGIGLSTAPVVAASLDTVAGARSGLAAATVNVARELGGVVAVAGLGALVVARLSADLVRNLATAGVPGARTDVLVEALLRGASEREILTLAGDQVPIGTLLRLRSTAEASYVSSVRVALAGAAAVMLVSALVCSRTVATRSQPRVDELDDA